jgi:hypothetical protein
MLKILHPTANQPIAHGLVPNISNGAHKFSRKQNVDPITQRIVNGKKQKCNLKTIYEHDIM